MKSLKFYGIEINKNNIFEGAIYGVVGMYALLEKVIAQYLRPYKLTPAKFNALMIIKHIGKDVGLSQIEISRRLIVSASNMTHLIDKLEEEGYVERVSLKGDRRVKLIKASKSGAELLDKVWPGYYQKIRQLANYLSQGELKQLTRILDQWNERINEPSVVYT